MRFALGPTDLLRDATYRRLWISIVISSLGGQVTLLALPLTAAVMLSATPIEMGVLTAMELAPFALFGLPVGVWLDRVNKLPVYVLGEITIAVIVSTVPVAWWLERLTMGWLYLVGFVLGLVNTVAGGAAQIVLTQVVPRERLVEANAKNTLATSTAEVMGPGAAGILIRLVGAPLALLANAVLLLLSASILRGLRATENVIYSRSAFWPAMWAGVRFVRDDRLLLTMAVCVGAWQLCAQAATVVHLLFATRQLGISARGVGLCYVALGFGTISAGLLGHRIATRLGCGPMLVLGLVICGAAWLLLSLAPSSAWGIACYATMLLLLGVGAEFIFINFLALRQAVTPAPLLGRMTSTMRWLSLVPSAPGALWGGWLGNHAGFRATLAISGIASVLFGIIAWRLPVIRSVKISPTLEARAQ